MRGLRTAEQWEYLLERLDGDRMKRYGAGVGDRLPTVGLGNQGEFAAMPGSAEQVEAREARKRLPSNRPETNLDSITLESMEKIIEFMPEDVTGLISPRPLLIVANGGYGIYDIVHPLEQIHGAFQRAGEPKLMVTLPYRERGLYAEPGLGEAMRHATEFFQRYLPPY